MNAVGAMKKGWAHVKARTEASATLPDCLFLALAVLLSLLFYVSKLGFYSDDWVFFSLLKSAGDSSLSRLYQALYAGDVVIRQRPTQMVLLVVLFRLFGLNPLGYHWVNATILLATSILFYLVLRELRQPRPVALAVPLVYILLPHYSTDRFWVAAFQATLSIPFYFLSLYADLKAIQNRPALQFTGWKLLSAVSLIINGLAYEVALPLFLFINPLVVWLSARQRYGAANGNRFIRKNGIPLFAGNLVALLLVIAFKALVNIRSSPAGSLISQILFLVSGALRVNFGTYGIGLPYILAWIFRHGPSVTLLIVAGLLGVLVFTYLYRLTGQPGNELPNQRAWLFYIGLGLIIFALGYAILIVSSDVWFTSTSLGNRTAIAAAIGVALVFTGLTGWVSTLRSLEPWRPSLFSLLAAGLCVTGFLITNTLANFWITAYEKQQVIVKDIREYIPTLPANSTLVLDGVCLEQGGAYIFTGKRDLGSLVKILYGDQSLWATAITNKPRVDENGLSVLTFRDWDFYPYSENLLLYNFSQKKLYHLTDVETAREYMVMASFNPEIHCSPGFAWGWNSK